MTDAAQDPRHLAARARYEMLAKRLFQPVQRAILIDFALLAGTAALAFVVAGQSGDLVPAVLIAWFGSAVAGIVGWSWLLDPARRAAFEVLMDHTNRESQAWLSETGTKLPATLRGADAWVRDHPNEPGAAAMLARLGRLDDARADLQTKVPPTVEEALHVDIFLRQLDLYDGARAESRDLHERWHALPNSAARSFRRGCLAALDAQVAADRDEDPWPVLAAARQEVGAVDPSARATRYARIIATMHILFAISVWFGAVFAAG
jgi:hypothetical protein